MSDFHAITMLRMCSWLFLILGVVSSFLIAIGHPRASSVGTTLIALLLALLGFFVVWAFLLTIASIAESLLDIRDQGRTE